MGAFQQMLWLGVLAAGVWAAAGCARPATGVDIVKEAKKPELYRMTNGEVELMVNAALGRIVRYGPVGGANMLWDDPKAPEAGSPFKGWINWGGDKVWVWPEADWGTWRGSAEGPPPGDPASGRYEVEVGERKLVMKSPVIAAYGMRVVREISLEATGTKVSMVNRLEKVAAGWQSLPVGVWTVTQTPAPKEVLAHLASGAKGPGYEAFKPNPWTEVSVKGSVVTMKRPASPWVKMGLNADALAVPEGDWLFIVSTLGTEKGGGKYEAFQRAQVFSDPDDSPFRPKGVGAYVEMEMTSPVKLLGLGESVELHVTWELRNLGKGGAGAEQIMAGLK